MNHDEQRRWLIRKLLEENIQYRGYKIPAGEQEQKDLLRSLMNVRMPKTIDRERLYLWQGDITALKVDAIVNAANSQMCGCFQPLHNCVDNIIHSKAGIELRLCCNDLMQAQGHEEPTGQAKITSAFNLPCKYVVHTVGPIVQGRLQKKHEELLASCYRSCLELAEEHEVKSNCILLHFYRSIYVSESAGSRDCSRNSPKLL